MVTTIQKTMTGLVVSAVVGVSLAASLLAHAQAVGGAISQQLSLGSSGADVTKLQTLLATNSDIYPQGLITGYYGPLTEDAVTQFQLDYGLPPVGRVGPETLSKLNSILAMATPTVDIAAPIITNVSAAPSSTDATITWNTNELAVGKIYFSTAPLTEQEASAPMTEAAISGSSIEESSSGVNHSLILNSLTSGETYYYVVESTDTAGNVSVTLPETFTTQS